MVKTSLEPAVRHETGRAGLPLTHCQVQLAGAARVMPELLLPNPKVSVAVSKINGFPVSWLSRLKLTGVVSFLLPSLTTVPPVAVRAPAEFDVSVALDSE